MGGYKAVWNGAGARRQVLGGAILIAIVVFSAGCPGPSSDGVLKSSAAIGFNVDQPPTRPAVTESPRMAVSALFAEVPGKTGSHAPTMVAFDDGELLAAWYSYDGPHELDGATIYTARREAAAADWSAPALHAEGPQSYGNPTLYHEGDRAWLFHAVVSAGWSSSRVVWRESADRGRTWSAPRDLDGPTGSNVRFSPLRTGAGELLLPAYDDFLKRSLFFSWDGHAWGLRSVVTTGLLTPNIQPAVVKLADDGLLAVMRGGENTWLWAMRSDDNGRTWSEPADAGLPNEGTSTALLRLRDGTLVMAYDQTQEKTSQLVAALSADEGRTWLPPRELVGGTGAFRYPFLAEGPDGTIHVAYSHDRKWIGHIELNCAFLSTGP